MTRERVLLASTPHFQALRNAGFSPIMLTNPQGQPDVLLAVRERGGWFDILAVHSATDVEGRRVRSGDLDTGSLLGLPSVTPRWRRQGTLADVVTELLELP